MSTAIEAVPLFCNVVPSREWQLQNALVTARVAPAATVVVPVPVIVPELQTKVPEMVRLPAPLRVPASSSVPAVALRLKVPSTVPEIWTTPAPFTWGVPPRVWAPSSPSTAPPPASKLPVETPPLPALRFRLPEPTRTAPSLSKATYT